MELLINNCDELCRDFSPNLNGDEIKFRDKLIKDVLKLGSRAEKILGIINILFKTYNHNSYSKGAESTPKSGQKRKAGRKSNRRDKKLATNLVIRGRRLWFISRQIDFFRYLVDLRYTGNNRP